MTSSPTSDVAPEDFAALAELAESFSALVDVMDEAGSRPLRSDDVVTAAARCVPAAEAVGLQVLSGDQVMSIAATSDVFDRLDAARLATREGPACDVIEVNDVVVVDDLASDDRWPDYRARVLADTEVRTLVVYRVFLAPGTRAALTFVSSWPFAFDQVAVALGSLFASYASLTALTEHVLRDVVPRSRAREVHREIGIAVGLLMAAHQLPVEEAYARLHAASRRLSGSLHSTAQRTIGDHASR